MTLHSRVCIHFCFRREISKFLLNREPTRSKYGFEFSFRRIRGNSSYIKIGDHDASSMAGTAKGGFGQNCPQARYTDA